MIRILAFIVFVLASCQPAMAQLGMRKFVAHGHLKCSDGTGETDPSSLTKRARYCDFVHEELEEILRGEGAPTCDNGSSPIYIDDGCDELLVDEHGIEKVPQLQFVERATGQEWTVELIYTFSSGVTKGVSRRGSTFCEAFLKAQKAMCDKQATYGPICRGTGSASAKMPGREDSIAICAPYSLHCAPTAPEQPCVVQHCATQSTSKCHPRLRLLRSWK